MFSLRSNALPARSLRSEREPPQGGGLASCRSLAKKEAPMARPKIAPEALRSATIGVRVSPAEYEALREKAAALRLTPAQWLREAALSRRLPPPPVPPVNLETYRELGKIGGNLNQIAARLNAGGTAPELAAAVGELAALVRRVRLEALGATEAE